MSIIHPFRITFSNPTAENLGNEPMRMGNHNQHAIDSIKYVISREKESNSDIRLQRGFLAVLVVHFSGGQL